MLAHETLSITMAAWLAETTLVASAMALLVALITRFGKPADIAGLVGFIVGPRGRWLHGTGIAWGLTGWFDAL